MLIFYIPVLPSIFFLSLNLLTFLCLYGSISNFSKFIGSNFFFSQIKNFSPCNICEKQWIFFQEPNYFSDCNQHSNFSLGKMWPNSHFFIFLQFKMQFIPLVIIIHHILPTLQYSFEQSFPIDILCTYFTGANS